MKKLQEQTVKSYGLCFEERDDDEKAIMHNFEPWVNSA